AGGGNISLRSSECSRAESGSSTAPHAGQKRGSPETFVPQLKHFPAETCGLSSFCFIFLPTGSGGRNSDSPIMPLSFLGSGEEIGFPHFRQNLPGLVNSAPQFLHE